MDVSPSTGLSAATVPAPNLLHSLLLRQLARLGLSAGSLPTSVLQWTRLLEQVSCSYGDAEREHHLIEHSLDISAQEVHALSEVLADKTRELEEIIVQLVASEAQARDVLDHAADGIVVVTPDGAVQTWNRAAERMFGYSAEETLNRSLHAMLPIEGGLSSVVGQRRELMGRRKDGTLFAADLYVSEVRNECIHLLTGIVRDITAEKEVEAKLAATHRQLLNVSRMAGMAEVATGVLHNVGNVLNSVGVGTETAAERLQQSKVPSLQRVVDLLQQHEADLGAFLTQDERGRMLPRYLTKLAAQLLGERDGLIQELAALRQGIEHMKIVINMQQSYAKVGGVSEVLDLASLVDDTLQFNAGSFAAAGVDLDRAYDPLPPVRIEKHKVLQILMNLLSNAKHAVQAHDGPERRVRVRIAHGEQGVVQIDVSDSGIGIGEDNLTRIFSHGFTTRKDGHGFGLHSSALAAKEMGGSLSCHSDGLGKGATFSLVLPYQPGG